MKGRGNKTLLVLAGLLAAALFLFVIERQTNFLSPLYSLIITPFKPAGEAALDGAAALAGEPAAEADTATLQERIAELEKTIAQLQVEIVELREVEQDYNRLAQVADYLAENTGQKVVSADVIARDTSSYLRWIIINRGARDGIRVGNPVINELGLVGQVEEIAANAAWVRLAIDPGSAVNAFTQKTRAEGTIVGLLQGGMQMTLIPQASLVEPGDLVLTSGLGGLFPANIVIGQITSVRKQQAELFQSAEIRPIVRFDELDIVSVITDFTPIDTSIFDDVIEAQSEAGQ